MMRLQSASWRKTVAEKRKRRFFIGARAARLPPENAALGDETRKQVNEKTMNARQRADAFWKTQQNKYVAIKYL